MTEKMQKMYVIYFQNIGRLHKETFIIKIQCYPILHLLPSFQQSRNIREKNDTLDLFLQQNIPKGYKSAIHLRIVSSSKIFKQENLKLHLHIKVSKLFSSLNSNTELCSKILVLQTIFILEIKSNIIWSIRLISYYCKKQLQTVV